MGHNLEDLNIDYKVWDLENEFSPIIAACLWCDIDPNKESNSASLKNKVLKMQEILEKAAQNGTLSCVWPQGVPCLPRGAKNSYDTCRKLGRELKFDRVNLKAYAESIGQRPLFIFSEDRRSDKHVVSSDAVSRIWGNEGYYRVFLSHKSEYKEKAAELKKQLRSLKISCFVAHEDIQPTQEWQKEIENALFSMNAFVALMTEDFHDSDWTAQEVGFAFCRGVPSIALKLGKDPYGFIGKFQALSCRWDTWDTVAQEIVKKLPLK